MLSIIIAIVDPSKKTTASPAAPVPIASASVASSPTEPPSPAASRSASASAPPAPQQTSGDFKRLDSGTQRGLRDCVIEYKNAQMGAGTSTFSALVLDGSGKPYAPADSDPYSVTLQLAVTSTDGSSYSVTEALGGGSRTAADNGGSDWFSDNQGGVQVSADSTEGTVDSTVPVPLAQVKSAQGSIVVTNQNDSNYLKQDTCSVRPSQ